MEQMLYMEKCTDEYELIKIIQPLYYETFNVFMFSVYSFIISLISKDESEEEKVEDEAESFMKRMKKEKKTEKLDSSFMDLLAPLCLGDIHIGYEQAKGMNIWEIKSFSKKVSELYGSNKKDNVERKNVDEMEIQKL